MRRLSRLCLAAAIALGLASSAAAAPPKPLFAGDEMLRLTLRAPVGELSRMRPEEERALAGTLMLQGAAPETHAVTLSPRGITRRRKEVCTFPPLRLEFTQKPAEASLFRGQKRLKLVTHCRSAERFQQHLLLERAAYRLYNQVTPMSFNVRLATIEYLDEAGRPVTTRLAFFIEDTDDMAERNGLKHLETTGRNTAAQLSPGDAARYAMFQMLIGNLDWSMVAGPPGEECCHNSKLVGPKGATTGLVPAPYDFDFSGLVDAPYATPPQSIALPNVRARRYRGYCRHNDLAPAAAADLVARRSALIAVLANDPLLEGKSRDRAIAYLGGFLDQIGQPTEVAKLLRTCVD